jgi:uncharacterized protein involved in exopolysaccharide biosynthesis
MKNMPDSECPKEKEIVYAYPVMPGDINREDEIDLVELWRLVWAGKLFIISFVVFCTLIAGVVSFAFLPSIYKSTATLIPAKQEKSTLGSLGGLLGNVPFPIALPGQGASNIMSFLESRTLKERLINKHNLLPVLYTDIWNPETKTWKVADPDTKPTIVKALQSGILDAVFSVSQDKRTELITISWSGKDPAFCALMLQRVINELIFFLENEYVSDARREREFVEGQLVSAKEDLEYWDRQIPSEKLKLTEITRERLASQTVYTELRKQLELAKINEAKKLDTFEVLDNPYVPEKPFKPRKGLIVALTFVSSAFIALFGVFFLNFIRNQKKNETPVAES